MLPAEGWIVADRKRFEKLKAKGEMNHLKGGHGYDNQLESMRVIFIAHGQAFKQSKVVDGFENVQVYNIMCRILGLKPAPNDGNFDTAKEVLVDGSATQ